MLDGDDETVLFELERLVGWYKANIRNIVNNRIVFNKLAHAEVLIELPRVYNTLEANPDWFEEQRASIKGESSGGSSQKRRMVFVSHSHKDGEYVRAFVDLLRKLGLTSENLFCSSVPGFDIPMGKDIFDFLRNHFEGFELCVIFLLSKDNFYSSAACLNEMGAAWVRGFQCYSVLLPGMSYGDMKGVLTSNAIVARLEAEDASHRLNQLKDGIVEFLGLEMPNESAWDYDKNAFLKRVREIAAAVE